jgi:hypothetical protein
MRTKVDPVVIQAAARLLDEDPGISNPRILQRLAQLFGAEITRMIPVTRVERLVREPALLFLRHGTTNGPREPEPTGEGRVQVTGPARARGKGRRKGASPKAGPRGEELDAALLEAFALGAATDTAADVVEAFRKLDTLRRRLK